MDIEIQTNIAEANNINQNENQSLMNSQDSIIDNLIDQTDFQQEKEEAREDEETVPTSSSHETETGILAMVFIPVESQTTKMNYTNLQLMIKNEHDAFCKFHYPTIGKLMLNLNSLFLDIIAKLQFDEDLDFDKFKLFKDTIQDKIHELLSIQLEEVSKYANEAYSLSEKTSSDFINHRNEMLDAFFSREIILRSNRLYCDQTLSQLFDTICKDLHPASKFLHLATKMHALIVQAIYAHNAIVANIIILVYHAIKKFIELFLTDFIRSSLKNEVSEKVFGMLYEDMLYASIGHLVSTLMSPLELYLTLNQTQLNSNFIREGLVLLALSYKNQPQSSQPHSSSFEDNSSRNSNISEIIQTEKTILELNGMTQPSKGFWSFFSK